MMGKINANKFDQVEAARTNKSGQAAQTGKKQEANATGQPGVQTGDRVEFSGRAAEFGRAIDVIRDLPEIREDVVQELKERVAAGTYQPSGEDIADAIMKDESA